MKRYVIDASTAVKWYIPEPLSSQAVYFLDLARDDKAMLMAPDLILAEVGNTLWKKRATNELSSDETRTIVQSVAEAFPALTIPSAILLPGAVEIASAYSRSVYDSLYIALAAAEGAPLYTADERLVNAMRDSAYGKLVRYLGDLTS